MTILRRLWGRGPRRGANLGKRLELKPMITLRQALVAGLAAALMCCIAPAVIADEQSAEPETLRCINARSIRRTEVINDDYVVFWVQGRRLYLNELPKSCTGLSQDRRFSFETTTRSLCARDKIRILKESARGIYEGRSCSLGRFQQTTVEDLNAFIESRTVTPEPEEVESAEVEDVVTDES